MASSGRQTQQEEGNNDKNHQVPGKRRHGSLKQSGWVQLYIFLSTSTCVLPGFISNSCSRVLWFLCSAIRNMISAQRMNHLGLYLEPLVRRVVWNESFVVYKSFWLLSSSNFINNVLSI